MTNNVDKASRLFQYLSDIQSMKEKPIRRVDEYRENGGSVISLGQVLRMTKQFPTYIDFSLANDESHGKNEAEFSDDTPSTLLELRRPTMSTPPRPASHVANWLEGEFDDAKIRPQIRAAIHNGGHELPFEEVSDEVRNDVTEWLSEWDKWAQEREVAALYQKFFDLRVKANQEADTFELVLGVGRLFWDLGDTRSLDRHLFSFRLETKMDKDSGSITVDFVRGSLRPELEAIPSTELSDGRFIETVRDFTRENRDIAYSRRDFSELGRLTANCLSTSAVYSDSIEPSADSSSPILSWAPSIILRRRQRIGLSTTFKAISQSIQANAAIPSGLKTLIDPRDQSYVVPSPNEGATTVVDNEIFSPLPLNKRQLDVLRRVDTHAQTIVQGPPGTGKTHMAAALLSHLLAQGQRVLVTAEKDRALYELRSKLPREISQLAVSVLGSSSQDQAELEVAISTIQQRANDFDVSDSSKKISTLLDEIDKLRERRTAAANSWSKRMMFERSPIGVPSYNHHPSKALEKVRKHEVRYGWIESLSLRDISKPFPLSEEETNELLSLLSRQSSLAKASLKSNFDSTRLPTPQTFESVYAEMERSREAFLNAKQALNDQDFAVWVENTESQSAIKALVNEAVKLTELLAQLSSRWQFLPKEPLNPQELDRLKAVVEKATSQVAASREFESRTKEIRRITVNGPVDAYVPTARNLLIALENGKSINTKTDGSVKIPLLGGTFIKEAMPFFENVRINSLIPTTAATIQGYLNHVELMWSLKQLRNTWPHYTHSVSDPSEEINGIEAQLTATTEHLNAIQRRAQVIKQLSDRGFSISQESVRQFSKSLIEFSRVEGLQAQWENAEKNAQAFKSIAVELGLKSASTDEERHLVSAIQEGDALAYTEAFNRFHNASKASEKIRRLRKLKKQVSDWSVNLIEAIESDPELWKDRLVSIEKARRWQNAKTVLKRKHPDQPDAIQAEIARIDDRLHQVVTELAAERAWSAAVNGDRIDSETRSLMVAYAQAVKRLGKGKGKHADKKRADVRKHLESCRSAVPVWIMPIYKVIDQFELKENMFDVVIVDEASQAGIEAIFLQYLAPRIVVIGDDRQVSPSAVGDSPEEFEKIARQYLYDFSYIDTWTDPQRSLFDHADQLYGGRIVLDEHRRCVPEIIEFSNKLVYRPNGIPLKPVRQVTADRLAPFKVTHTPNAFTQNKSNKAEANALVARLKKALDDPAYNGKSFGVISLLSTSNQDKYLREQLLNELPTSVWEERDLRIGTPAEFQGAERDVIFLSMVSAPDPAGRITSLTRSTYIQRYNVAVSRARDQVWLFHSISRENLTNPDDVRSVLLDHAYTIAQQSPEVMEASIVPFDERVEPFDSLFEQRVYNELVQRGYYVKPQVDAFGYRIDLVVQGRHNRLAVECDGDFWHGDDQAKSDLSRQRELERLGWSFVRIFESDFYLDQEEQIERVVKELNRIGVQPGQVSAELGSDSENIEVIESVFNQTIAELGEKETTLEDPRSSASAGTVMAPKIEDPTEERAIDMAEPSSIATPVIAVEAPDESFREEAPPVPQNEVSAEAVSAQSLSPYSEFEGQNPSVYEASQDEIEKGLLKILEIEGPIKSDLLYSRFVRAGGDLKVNKRARSSLNKALSALLRDGIVNCVEPMDANGYVDKTFYLSSQPPVRVRERGTRRLEEIPVGELNAIANIIASKFDPRNEERFLRAMLDLLDLQRLTEKARGILNIHRMNLLRGRGA